MKRSYVVALIVIILAISGCGGAGDTVQETDIAVQPTQGESVDDTETAQFVPTSTENIGTDNIDPPDTATSTLSAEAYGTEIANLATADVLPTPLPVTAEASAQGLNAGNGDVTSFYNTQVRYPNTMRISLELVFRELRIQPTPLSDEFQNAINDDIPTPVIVDDDVIQITPPPARDTERINNLPLYVIVVLDCPETRFEGCGIQDARRLNLRGINTWSWTVQPRLELSAQYDFSLQLFSSDADGNVTSTTPLYSEEFVVQVQTNALASLLSDNAGAFVIAVSIIVLAVVGLVALRGRQSTVKSIGVSAFVSYKRRGSWGIAEKIHDGLTARGVDTFIDSKDLHEGDFEARLTTEINNRDYVVVVLVPETLQSEWVVKEIQYALEHGKTVIPVLIEGLKMEDLNLPESITDLRKQNAVSLYQKYFEAGLDEILTFLKPLQ